MATKTAQATVYHFYADPGHGWLKVPRSELLRLDAPGTCWNSTGGPSKPLLDTISNYSYKHLGMVYLEEDCDMAKFMAAKKHAGETVEIVDHHTNSDSHIRRKRPLWS